MQDVKVSILPKKLYVESIKRADECFDRYMFHIVLQNKTHGRVRAERVELVLKNPAYGSKLIQVFEGDLLSQLFNRSQRFVEDSDAGTIDISPERMRGIVGYKIECEGALQFTDVEFNFFGRLPDGNAVEGRQQRALYRDAAQTALTLPMRGRWWVVGGHSNLEPHTRSYLRAITYAYDFIQIGENGKSYQGEGIKNSDYYSYNQPVLAAAEGYVILANDGVEENVPSKTPQNDPECYDDPASIPMAGNHVVVKHNDNEYTFYAHLQPRLAVAAGQEVQRGQTLGYVGNSGASTEPHLHFHLADGPTLDSSYGIPVSFVNWREDAFSITPAMVERGIILSREFVESVEDEQSLNSNITVQIDVIDCRKPIQGSCY